MKFKELLKPKLKATFIYFVISLLIFLIPAAFIVFDWYPQPYFSHAGGLQGIRIIAIVHLILGPVLTFIIFNPNKSQKAINFDFSIITLAQISALIWGTTVIYSQRPIAAVYYNDAFQVIIEEVYGEQEISLDKLSSFSESSPPLIYVRKPSDPDEMAAVMAWAFVEGKPESALGMLYSPLVEHISDLAHNNSDNIALIQKDADSNKDLADLLHQHNTHINNVVATLFEGRYGNDWLIISKQGELLGSIQNHEYN